MITPVILWFRHDLRLTDQRALQAALAAGRPVIPVYVYDSTVGEAGRWWLHHSLLALQRALAARQCPLLIVSGDAADRIVELVRTSGADKLYYSRGYTAHSIRTETALERKLGEQVTIHAGHDYYLRQPGTVLSKSGRAYKVFTPFWKACIAGPEPDRPMAAPATIPATDAGTFAQVQSQLNAKTVDDLGLLAMSGDRAPGLQALWEPGERGALQRLAHFSRQVAAYARLRDRPDHDGTSRLSPCLHFGELSPRQVWHAINDASQAAATSAGAEAFLRQLYWRDFSGHLLLHFPDLPDKPLRPGYERFNWRDSASARDAWQRGQTGYPLIDAGMRQLWASGWMHNRVRMLVASFLVKNLLICWQTGADWFLDTLVDADIANNSASWQWVAGCGTDAAPYFRIFNPVLQSKKFDPDGHYIRRWIPEIADLPDSLVHTPWQADRATQIAHNVRIGTDYPDPIVELAESRQRALDAYKALRSLLQSPAISPGSSVG